MESKFKVPESVLLSIYRKQEYEKKLLINVLTFVEMVPSPFLSNISKAPLKAWSSSGLSLSAILNKSKKRLVLPSVQDINSVYLLLLKWYHLGFCQTCQKRLWRPAGLLVSACLPFWASNKRLVHTRISAHNFFHSTIVSPLRLCWVSRDLKKFKVLEFVELVHCFSAKM